MFTNLSESLLTGKDRLQLSSAEIYRTTSGTERDTAELVCCRNWVPKTGEQDGGNKTWKYWFPGLYLEDIGIWLSRKLPFECKNIAKKCYLKKKKPYFLKKIWKLCKFLAI